MVACRSSCLVPLSQLSESQMSTGNPVADSHHIDGSCEVVISFKLDNLYSSKGYDEVLPQSPRANSHPMVNRNVYLDDTDETLTSTPTACTYDPGENADLAEIRTPEKSHVSSWRSLTAEVLIPVNETDPLTLMSLESQPCEGDVEPQEEVDSRQPSDLESVKNGTVDQSRDAVPYQYTKVDVDSLDFIQLYGTSTEDAVTVDCSVIHERILSKILKEGEEKSFIVTLVNALDDPESEEDEGSVPCDVINSGSETCPSEHCQAAVNDEQIPTCEIEWFNSAVRFQRIKEFKINSHPFAESEKYYRSDDVCSDRGLQGDNECTLFKTSPKRIINDDCPSEEPLPRVETPMDRFKALKLDIDVDLGFLRKRKRDVPGTEGSRRSEKVLHKSVASDNNATLASLEEKRRHVTNCQSERKERRKLNKLVLPVERRGVVQDEPRSRMSDDDSDVTSCRTYKDLRIGFNTNSLDRDIPHSPRADSGSMHREASPTKDNISKRGKLSDACNSSGSTKGVKPVRSKGISDRVFGTEIAQNSDWSSEMWGSFINVIHSRKRTLGHGSFSTVSFAFLRLTPSLKMSSARSNGSMVSSCPKVKEPNFDDTNVKDLESSDDVMDDINIDVVDKGSIARDEKFPPTSTSHSDGSIIPEQDDMDNGMSNDLAASEDSGSNMLSQISDSNMPSGTITETEGDALDLMCNVIEGHCTKCTNVRTLDCAVKSINDVFLQARFQYIREKEMMLHFHANVLKPLACRFHNTDGNRVYQLLMPKAQGDLLDMLKCIIKYRTNNNTNHIYIANQSTGKQERKIIGLSETEVKFLFYQVLSGLAFIQMCFQANIHRHSDIKLQNILVFCADEDRYNPMRWRLCLADFGCSIMLHPTQHLEGAGLFKNLQETISKEWRSHLCNQLTSFVRGTVRCNAPETLSYDRHGNPRSNRNNNLLAAYKRNLPLTPHATEDPTRTPSVWSRSDINDELCPGTPRTHEKVSGTSESDPAEYFTIDMTADMWSAGIVLSELAKFGGYVPPNECDQSSQKSKNDALSSEYINQRLNGTLGRGMFCRNNAVVRLKMQLESARDKMSPKPRKNPVFGEKAKHQNNQGGALTDECLNQALASDIASKCDIDFPMRIRKLKREYCWWEYPKFSNGFWSLLANLLSYNPEDRYLAVEALGHSWFDSTENNSRPIFDDIDALIAEQQIHLPMEHFYYVGSSLSLHNGSKKSCSNMEMPTVGIKREALMHPDNSDLVLESIGAYGKAGRTSHAWFAGPLHFRLQELGETGVSIPDYVAQICRRETVVLESREKEFFGTHGFVLSQLLAIKRRYGLSWEGLMSARSVHLLGKRLLNRDGA
ncbi:serine threonine kinase [Babesia ovis]|uniref:Serine threonine kinase n=1 Tax=Babesia ovis TaxID=5869 RepID=A0A9W5WVE7_BABOV|nr:serine threonine kinase [Babesia ovis]